MKEREGDGDVEDKRPLGVEESETDTERDCICHYESESLPKIGS